MKKEPVRMHLFERNERETEEGRAVGREGGREGKKLGR